ncbi:hypothetical protein LBMAG53_04850 [Planctomycetota bacterium]|nr:hypothetical protein LBMAG53_04850 [Planctomycetota bacterium]
MRVLLLLLLIWAAGAAEPSGGRVSVVLAAPLTTRVTAAQAPPAAGVTVVATVTVPAGAPADLGVGAWLRDQHGQWFQRCRPGILTVGTTNLRIAVGPDDPVLGEGHRAGWGPASAATMAEAGLFFWSASASSATIQVGDLHLTAPAVELASAIVTPHQRLLDLDPDGAGSTDLRGRTGVRWEVRCRPDPAPANPYDDSEFALDAEISEPDGTVRRIPGFFHQPMTLADRGDAESAVPNGSGRFAIRFRPAKPGRHAVTLVARWANGTPQRLVLPSLAVSGPPWDGYVRADADPRFFSADGKLVWPIGVNLRSINDVRSQERMATRLTPSRGTISYAAFFDRFTTAGCNAFEIWLASWNLAMEWRADWPGYQGVGRYHPGNAERLDRLLDLAESKSVRINVVLNNHGQASPKSDREWPHNPYNAERGGRLATAQELFTDPWAEAMQCRVRRYLVARYADSPAILGWKLWSEVNLTAGGDTLPLWHERAALHLAGIDPYRHPISSHWSGDYKVANPAICNLPSITYVCIDAYHGRREQPFSEMVARSMLDPSRGLHQYRKPGLITEFGGNWDGGNQEQVAAEHASAGFAALVSGHAGAPMLWWWEWIDQGERWSPYAAVSAFQRGEDLRGNDASSAALSATSPAGTLWARAWVRPGRLLGYVLDAAWGTNGGESRSHCSAEIVVGTAIQAGRIQVDWWNADRGVVVERTTIRHPGGQLVLPVPAFRRHVAFKMSRASDAAESASP